MDTPHYHEHHFKDIFWPLLIEVTLITLIGLLGSFFLTSLGQDIKSIYKIVMTIINFFVIFFACLSFGGLTIFAHYAGKGKHHHNPPILKVVLLINLTIAFIFLIGLNIFASKIIYIFDHHLSDMTKAVNLLRIASISLPFLAMTPLLGNYMRSFGHDLEPMWATIISFLMNGITNSLIIFVFQKSATLLAISFVLTHLINFILHVVFARLHIKVTLQETTYQIKDVLRQILNIGLPTILELLAEFFLVTIILAILFLNHLLSFELVENLLLVSFIPASSLGHALALKVAFMNSRQEYQQSKLLTNTVAKWAVIFGVGLSFFMVLLAKPLANFSLMFLHLSNQTMNEVQAIIVPCLWIMLTFELGRSLTHIYAESLKVSGDAWFVGIIHLVMILLFGGSLSYLFAIYLDLKMIGVALSLTISHLLMGAILLWRANSKYYTKHPLNL